jgi:hypothetical protein
VIVGEAFTVIPIVDVAEHPVNVLVPTTVYIVVELGDTTCDAPFKLPGFQT